MSAVEFNSISGDLRVRRDSEGNLVLELLGLGDDWVSASPRCFAPSLLAAVYKMGAQPGAEEEVQDEREV